MNHFIKILFFSLVLLTTNCQDQSVKASFSQCPGLQIQQKVPQKFALLTMTYNRKGKMDVFTSYLQHYATMKCEGFDQIYIVWNNQETPQSLGVYQNKDKWVNKVIITQTPSNKIDWKYSIPYESQKQIFLGLDDDQRTSCAQMMKLFNSWRSYAIGKIGPLYSFAERAQTYNYKTNSFQYLDPYSFGDRKTHYFSVSLMGCGFVSRHLMDIYYSDLQVVAKMRQVVQQKQNCEDILMNFLMSYFYPQIIPKSMHITFTNAGVKYGGLSNRKTHKTDRHQCLNQFSQILGLNPLRHVKFQDKMQKSVQRMDFTCLIKQKKQYLTKLFKRKTLQEIFSQNTVPSESVDMEQQSKTVQDSKQVDIQTSLRNNQNKLKTQIEDKIKNDQAINNVQLSNKIKKSSIDENKLKQNQESFINADKLKQQRIKQQNNKRSYVTSNVIKDKKTISNDDKVNMKSLNIQKYRNQQIKNNSSLTGVIPLQVQILIISTVLILLLIIKVIKQCSKNSSGTKKGKIDIHQRISKSNFKKSKNRIKAESRRVQQDTQNLNQIYNQLEVQ